MPRTPRRTRASNKNAHPGVVDRAKSRRTPLQAQKMRKDKAQAKVAREEEKAKNISRMAEFEHNDMVEEQLDAVTPRAPPLFTPKPTRNQHYAVLTPLPAPAMGQTDASDSVDEVSSFFQPLTETEEESINSAVEESEATPIKRRGVAKEATKKAAGKKRANDSAPKVNSKVVLFSFW